ncbi:phosphoenolpyruvate synthase [Chloroflexota bacterium]
MPKEQQNILWFDEVDKWDIHLAGGKGANLGEMTKAKIPVPPGFIVTAGAYFRFLQDSGLSNEVSELLRTLDPGNSKKLQQVATKIKDLLKGATMPPDIASEIRQSYNKLGGGPVAVRSSATAEDLPEASFAGQQETFLNIQGEERVVAAVQGCWASLFEPRAIFYRHQHGFDHLKVGIAVPVQEMVQSEVSGVMFTVEPLTSDRAKIIIEAVFGLGEAVVSGEVTPDLYVVDKKKLEIVEKTIEKQERQLTKNPVSRATETNVWVPIHDANQTQQKLADKDIIALATMGKHIEEVYRFPQDIEWARNRDELFIVQTRPVTTLPGTTTEAMAEVEASPEIKAVAILSGVAASPGIAVGPVRIVPESSQIDKVEEGDILVAEMTTPDFVPAMKRAAAIVTDRGGRTAHAAIVSREMGIPCVVGTKQATKILTDGQLITIDGARGKVYEGKVAEPKAPAPITVLKRRIKTKTRVYVNLAEPELAEAVAARDVDGVGLLRAEFMVAQIGEHPRYLLSQNRGGEFTEKLSQGLSTFAKAFSPRPVVFRTTDFKTNEYRNLKGGQEYEEEEENPMLGYRGCSRYIRELDAFKLEIEAIKRVREKYRNLWVMLPFVRTVEELVAVKKVLESEGLSQSSDFKLWMMVEVPSNVILMDKFLDIGLDGISIGSNDLTQLILGIDRDSGKLAEEFDERNEAVLIALERVVKISRKRGITSSICGQAPSFYPELTQKLVQWGITSVSVSPDMIDRTKEIIADAEARLATPSA